MKAVYAKAFTDVIGDDGKVIERHWFAAHVLFNAELKAMIRADINRRVAEHNARARQCA